MAETKAASETPKRKIFAQMTIYIGSFIGGPLAAGYMFAENFKT